MSKKVRSHFFAHGDNCAENHTSKVWFSYCSQLCSCFIIKLWTKSKCKTST